MLIDIYCCLFVNPTASVVTKSPQSWCKFCIGDLAENKGTLEASKMK